MLKIKNGGLDQYGAGPFERQQFGTAGVEGVNVFATTLTNMTLLCPSVGFKVALHATLLMVIRVSSCCHRNLISLMVHSGNR